jgi:chromosome segregation ATPase
LDQGYQEDQRLLLRLKGMQVPLPLDLRSSDDQFAAHRQKEKLKLMKMIYDSQIRQGTLHGSILQLQKSAPLMPAASALAHQQLLKAQIKDLEAQISSYPEEKLPYNLGDNQWDDAQLLELEGELKTLEKNYSQLKILMDQMSKKAQASRMTVSQHIEEVKLQSSLDDLNHQGSVLRVDLDDLRSQMIDLDKRKSRLEDMIHQLP